MLARLSWLLSWLTGLLARLLSWLSLTIRRLLRGGRIQLLFERIESARHRLLLRR